jgi:hypothetical protein
MEGACVVGLGLLGVEGAEALAFGLLYHLVQLLPPILLGSYFAFRGHFGREILDESPGGGQGGGETSGDSGI